jgi:hypothetical protein
MTHAAIAVVTQKAANAPRSVIMIDCEIIAISSIDVRQFANRAAPILRCREGFVILKFKAV